MEIYELYKKIEKSLKHIEPAELKRNRKEVYRLKQTEFAALIGVKYETYKTWEQGRYFPSSPARALLHIAMNDKEVFLKNRDELFEKIGEFTN